MTKKAVVWEFCCFLGCMRLLLHKMVDFMKNWFFSLILLLGCALSTPAAEYKFTRLTSTEDGLSYDAVKCMVQDKRGFIWIGTQKGLNRYDGTRFKVYGREDFGVASDHISSLAQDESGDIWIGTDNGVVVYDYETDSFLSVGRSGDQGAILNDRVYAIENDSKGRVWIGTRMSGLFIYDIATSTLKKVKLVKEDGQEVLNVYRIAIDRDDNLWLASYCENIYSLNQNTGIVTPLQIYQNGVATDYFERDDVEGLMVSTRSNDVLYVASKRYGLCEVKVRDGRVEHLYKISPDQRPIGLYFDGSKYLWMSLTDGLLRYDIAARTPSVLHSDKNDRFSLSDDYVTCVLSDKERGLWVGTTYGGVNYYGRHQDMFQKIYRTSSGLSLDGCVVKDFAQRTDGLVWVGTERQGLLLFNPSTGWIDCVDESQLPQNICALCVEGEKLWIGTPKGIHRYDYRSSEVSSYYHFGMESEDKDNRIVSIFLSTYGKLYAATSNGVFVYDRNNDSFTKIECIGDLPIEHMVEDSRGIIWMASYHDGVYSYDPFADRIVRHYCARYGSDVIPEMTSSMCLDDKGRVWTIGFSSGFFLYDAEKDGFITYDGKKIPSLPSDVFMSALSDYDGNLWISSDAGLVQFYPSSNTLKVFTTASGILQDNFNKCAIHLDTGEMIFGSSDGFIVFDPEAQVSDKEVSDVMITDLIVGNKVVRPGDKKSPIKNNINIVEKIRLSNTQNSFGFNFALSDLGQSGNNDIICKLEGYDQEWRNVTTDASVYYYNLPAKNYRLLLRSVNSSGLLSRSHKGVTVIVEPTFIGSPLGILCFVLSILVVLTVIILLLRRRDKERAKRKREEFERRKMDEMYNEKMNFFSNIIHEIKTPLTLLRTPLQNLMASNPSGIGAQEDLAVINNSTEYLDQLVKELLDFVRVERHGYVLDRKNVNLVEKISFHCFNFTEMAKDRNQRLTFTHDTDCVMTAVDIKAFNKIVNNIIHNAVKYASSYIDIHLEQKDDHVIVSFRNDGPEIPRSRRTEIFKQFVQFSNDHLPYSQSFGIGLPLARTLAELHGGSLVLSDSQETNFILTLPIVHVPETAVESENDEEVNVVPNRALLLLVEDNIDLLSYLKTKLKTDYNVISASSAEKALVAMSKYKVDMVLTDVGLRGMSGVELCRRINTDEETSHIPVIILSAISSVETKINCMRNGAVLYIEKPFSLDYLLACVKGILSKRDNMKEAYYTSGPTGMESPNFNLPDRDYEFIKNLDKLIMDNIGNASFSVQQMEEHLAMSRSSFNRKVKALLDTTPNDYLRSKRIAIAAKMLEQGNLQISEVCYAVGFNSPSYFSKCFKEVYGKLPLEYAKDFRNLPNSSHSE